MYPDQKARKYTTKISTNPHHQPYIERAYLEGHDEVVKDLIEFFEKMEGYQVEYSKSDVIDYLKEKLIRSNGRCIE